VTKRSQRRNASEFKQADCGDVIAISAEQSRSRRCSKRRFGKTNPSRISTVISVAAGFSLRDGARHRLPHGWDQGDSRLSLMSFGRANPLQAWRAAKAIWRNKADHAASK
jgi:hypothetical protein